MCDVCHRTLDTNLIGRKSVCPTRSEAKQYQNVGVWREKGLLQGRARRRVAHALKTPTPRKKAFSKARL